MFSWYEWGIILPAGLIFCSYNLSQILLYMEAFAAYEHWLERGYSGFRWESWFNGAI